MFAASKRELERAQDLLYGYAVQGQPNTQLAQDSSWFSSLKRSWPMLHYSGVSTTDLVKSATILFVALGISLFLFSLSGFYWFLLLPVAILAYQYFSISSKAFKRAESFERDYTALLLSLASAVRTGLDPLVALIRSAELFNQGSEVRSEIEKLKKAVEAGCAEDEAMHDFAITINHPDLPLFRTGFILARRQGSSLGDCLQRLAKVTRQRQSFRRKVKSAVAMQKLSAIGITVCALFMGILQIIANPESVRIALSHPLGIKAYTLGVGLIVIGLGWMFKMTSTRI